MTELLRERFVDRQDKTRKQFQGYTNDPIRVSFYDLDEKRVNDVTRKEANEISDANPFQIFYFQDGNSIQRELNITEVNNLVPNNDLASSSSCLTGPQLCGPPVVNIFGGEGLGALANAIISPISSSPIAFDILDGGKNYTSTPFAQLIDSCGKGSGSKLEVEMEDDKVNRILIKAPGDGYLSAPDGSLGGDGRVIPTTPTVPGVTPPTVPGVTPPTVPGVTPPTVPGVTPPTVPGVTPPTVPGVTPPTPTIGPSYPVVLEIEDIDIINPGFGYEPGNEIIITPDNGAVLEPVIDNGRIIQINVIKPGIGFVDFSIITTNSSTGYNLSARPIFRVIRLTEEEKQRRLTVSPGVQIISVIDCVGIIPPKVEFNRVPR
jgi:hypothetical protein